MRSSPFLFRPSPKWLLSATVLLLLGSLALPQMTSVRASFNYLFVFDITQSMNVGDGLGGARRLDSAKSALSDALASLPCGSRTGLAIFTGHRVFLLFTPVEVCANFAEVIETIGSIDWRMAWTARSEIAKGLILSLRLADGLGPTTRIVFFTDGHEAPPIHPTFRPPYQATNDHNRGTLIGVGGRKLAPIPKYDRNDRPIGHWAPDEVMQVDPYSLGRGGNRNDALVGVESGDLQTRIAAGQEHLSSLKHDYLDSLAHNYHLDMSILDQPERLAQVLTSDRYASPKPQKTDWRWLLALVALMTLTGSLLPHRQPSSG